MIFGSPPGLGVNADTNMVSDIAVIFEHQYEKDFLTLLIPACFEDLTSKDANMEMMVSNTIQPMRLPYISNVVTHAIGIIFVDHISS